MKAKIIQTDDGSHTIYLPELDETYHSTFGAINESRHVFIENGLANIQKLEISVLEIGFGTGLNALLTLDYALKNNLAITYTSIEKYPLEKEIYTNLNYTKQIPENEEVFLKIHEAEWERGIELNPDFTLKKIRMDILKEEVSLTEAVDIVYFDAFAPSKQPEMWSDKVFKQLYSVLINNGLLVTYSAAGAVKQALRSIGFKVKRLPGPSGKHHMLIAVKE